MASDAIALFQNLTLWFFLLWLFINSIKSVCLSIYLSVCLSINMKVKVLVAQSCLMLCDPMAPLSVDSPGKNTGVGGHSLLQGVFLTQGSNWGLPQCRQILYHLSHPYTVFSHHWHQRKKRKQQDEERGPQIVTNNSANPNGKCWASSYHLVVEPHPGQKWPGPGPSHHTQA